MKVIKYKCDATKKLSFKFDHLETTDKIIVEQDLIIKSRKINNFKEYLSFLKTFNIIVDHQAREQIILKKISSISNSKQYKERINKSWSKSLKLFKTN